MLRFSRALLPEIYSFEKIVSVRMQRSTKKTNDQKISSEKHQEKLVESKYLKQPGKNCLIKDQPCTKWSMLDLKAQIEDNLRQLLRLDHHFVESHLYTDLRLLFGYLASISSIGGSIYSYTHPWSEGIWLLLPCIIMYYVFIGIDIFIAKFIRKDIVFVGFRKDPLDNVYSQKQNL